MCVGENVIRLDHHQGHPHLLCRLGFGARMCDRLTWATARGLTVLLVAAVLVAGCGPLGSDEKSTAPAATSLPMATTVSSPRAASSPRIQSPPEATPLAGPRTSRSSPVASPAAALQPGTPVPARANARATPRVAPPTIAVSLGTTPVGTPAPPVAETCQPPADVPEAIGEAERQTTETVNVRVGPGLDCDLVTQVEAGTTVTVESGPVEADDLLWVLVTLDGEQGWVAEEYVPGEEVT